MFALEHIPAHTTLAQLAKEGWCVWIRVGVQTPMLCIRQEMVWVFGVRNGCGKALQEIHLISC